MAKWVHADQYTTVTTHFQIKMTEKIVILFKKQLSIYKITIKYPTGVYFSYFFPIEHAGMEFKAVFTFLFKKTR